MCCIDTALEAVQLLCVYNGYSCSFCQSKHCTIVIINILNIYGIAANPSSSSSKFIYDCNGARSNNYFECLNCNVKISIFFTIHTSQFQFEHYFLRRSKKKTQIKLKMTRIVNCYVVTCHGANVSQSKNQNCI